MNSLGTLVIGIAGAVAAGWAIRFGYTLVFGDSDKQLRSFLLRQRSQWKRQRYIRAFVSAVQGRTIVSDAMVTVNTLTASLAAFCMSTAIIGVIAMAEFSDTQVLHVEQVARVDGLLSRLDEPAKEHSADQLRSDLKDIRQELIDKEPQLKAIRRGARILFLVPSGLATVCIFAAAFWGPVFVRKRAFAFEVERFTLRMQGLATPAELAELALLEACVTDEESLRRFIKATRVIADRHSVPQLATRFDLWSGEEKASAVNRGA